MTTTLAIRRSTILADARDGALSRLPHLRRVGALPREDDERIAAVASRVRVGASIASTARVGAGGATAVTAGAIYLIAAGAQGLFSYALFRGGGWVFQEKHPVWGVIFALGTMSSLYAAGNKIAET